MIAGRATISSPICFSSRGPSKTWNSKPYNYFPGKFADPHMFSYKNQASSLFFTFSPAKIRPHFSVKASASVGSAEYTEEPATSVKFEKSLSLPGCSSPLSLLGTGYREKVFAIIGVKVYAAALYVNQSILSKLDAWKGQTTAKIQQDLSLFGTIYRAPLEKSLQIVLVRDVDGKTFWNALDDAVSPRIKAPTPVDECALSTFRSIFQGLSLKKGTFIFLTWIDPSKMLGCIMIPGLHLIRWVAIWGGCYN